MNEKIFVFLIIKLWSLIILFTILFIIPFFRSLNESEISTSIEMGSRNEHQWKNLQKDKSLNLKTEKIT